MTLQPTDTGWEPAGVGLPSIILHQGLFGPGKTSMIKGFLSLKKRVRASRENTGPGEHQRLMPPRVSV